MPIIVNTNTASINAQRNLGKTANMMSKALERLSSGLRINRAGDDAAGLAIANGLQSQIRGLNQAVRNAGDGLSLIGTAEGAIGQATEILQRIRELAVQSANDINSSTNRASIQDEVTAQISELTRIAATTSFNGSVLLDGTFANKNLQIGAMASQTISISISDFRATSLGKIAVTTGPNNVVATVIDGSGAGAASLLINGQTIGSSVGLDTVSTASADSSALAKVTAINASYASTGVSATVVGSSYTAGSAVTAGANATALDINGVSIISATNTLTTALSDSDGALRARINSKSNQTGVVATLDVANKIVLTAADGRNIQIANAGNAASGFAVATSTTFGKVKLTGDAAFNFVQGTVNQLGFAAAANAIAVDPTTAVSQVSVTTAAASTTAIQIIDAAIRQIDTGRGLLGAITNRLENTIANLQTSSENLAASESRIRDADFAAETANLTRAQILQQAGVAVLSQANVTPQSALTLLK